MADLTLIKQGPDYFKLIADALKIKNEQVHCCYDLFKNGATVPFMARYRKEKTGGLDEEQIRQIQEKLEYFSELEDRKISVIRRIEAQKKLTPELKKHIEEAVEKIRVEDLYAPYKFKKQTRACIAREAGLEPLAEIFIKQETQESSEELAKSYINDEKGVKTVEDAVKGAMDILAEQISDNAEWKAHIRDNERKKAVLTSQVKAKFEKKPSKFEMYYNFKEKVSALPSHRILAIKRGEKEGYIRTSIDMDDVYNSGYLAEKIIKGPGPFQGILNKMIEDSYHRLLKPAIENEIRRELKIKADEEAFIVFQKNLKDVLLAPPARHKVIMGVDPGFKSGTKLAVIDKTGLFLDHKTIHPLPPQKELEASKMILLAMIENYKVDIVAIGNGTASREIDEFIGTSIKELENPPVKIVVSEAGASVYSASTVARKEFPDLDVTVRGAISIGRRVQDPLAELVKIDPKSIGVGQYQHDVNQTELLKKLDQVVESCVNLIGVEVNTASESLLSYVSGINKSLAELIISFREKKGSFASRSSLVKVPKFGPKAFEQAAGFLRIPDADNALDGTAVHPECYEVVNNICEKEGIRLKEIIGNKEAVRKIEFEKYITPIVGLPTLLDIKKELEKPNRDPRKKFVCANFNPKVTRISDLKEGDWVEGVVSNITDFGIFVDVGVHQDGLVHISEVANRYVSDISNHFSTGDLVKVKVLSADPEQKRISLSMKSDPGPKSQGAGKNKPQRPPQKKKPRKPPATIDQLKSKYSGEKKNIKNTVKLKFSLRSLMKKGR